MEGSLLGLIVILSRHFPGGELRELRLDRIFGIQTEI
jgi:hypothetical protein